MIGRIVHKADFEKALAAPSRIRSAHFALHHVASSETPGSSGRVDSQSGKLSTGMKLEGVQPVDDLSGARLLGAVIPKRHARRAVTRNLLRRLIRAMAEGLQPGLPAGLWVVRLRAPFARDQYPSATSEALRLAVRQELAQLFSRAVARH
jgi:ribonuclease P protein component